MYKIIKEAAFENIPSRKLADWRISLKTGKNSSYLIYKIVGLTKLAGKQNLFLERQVAYELVVKYLKNLAIENETMATEFIKLGNNILYVIKKIKIQH